MAFDRDAFLAKAREIRVEPVRGYEGELYVREMSGADRDSFDRETYRLMKSGDDPAKGFRARLLVRTLCEPDGTRIFADSDVSEFDSFASGILEQLFEASAELNKSIVNDGESELEKN